MYNHQETTHIIFVCHGGDLEIKSFLLAYSLRKYCAGHYKMIAAIPQNEEPPSPDLISYFNTIGVERFSYSNPYLEKNTHSLLPGDKISHKIYAMEAYPEDGNLLFLDSDILAVKKFQLPKAFSDKAIQVKPANRCQIHSWEPIYSRFGLKMPNEKVWCSLDKKETAPYFNSGVVFMPKSFRSKLLSRWTSYFEQLSEAYNLDSKLYPAFHRDQVALSLALQKEDLPYETLEEQYNYPIRGLKIESERLPALVHYHHPASLIYEQICRMECEKAFQNQGFISTIIAKHPEWAYFISPYFKKKKLTFKVWLYMKKYKLKSLLKLNRPKNRT